MYLIKIISKYKLFILFALYLQIVKRLNFHKYITFVSDSMALSVTSGHVNNTPCESCDFFVRGSLVRVVVCKVSSACFNIKSM